MKKTYILFAIIFIISLGAKKVTYTTKVVPLVSEQSFYLNSATRLGGITRTVVEVDLPANTVEWYYTFYSTPNVTNNASINLLGQLTKLLVPSVAIADLTSSIIAPTGSGACSVYLLGENDRAPFLNKVDRKGGTLHYFVDGSRDNFISGTVRINNTITPGTYFIGMRNNSSMQGTNVHIEVAALVQEETH